MRVTSHRSAGSTTSRFLLLAGITGLLFCGTYATAQDPGTENITSEATETSVDDGVEVGAEVEEEVFEMAPWLDAW